MPEVVELAKRVAREQNAIFAPPWSTPPCHLLVLMEEAVSCGWAAFSQAEASRRGVEWLDLVRSDTLKAPLAALTDQFFKVMVRQIAQNTWINTVLSKALRVLQQAKVMSVPAGRQPGHSHGEAYLPRR
jgi:hypothetical protein